MGIGINVFICLLASEILTLQHYILHMDQNVRQTVVNQMYSTLREIDSYKYGLVSQEVLKLQASSLVFIKERLYLEDIERTISQDNPYKAYLLERIWSHVRKYWHGEVENVPSIRTIYNELEALQPTAIECERVFDALLENKRLDYFDLSPTQELAELLVELLDYRGGVVFNPDAGEGLIGNILNIGNSFFGTTK